MRSCFLLIVLVSSLLIPAPSRAVVFPVTSGGMSALSRAAVPRITNPLVARPDALRVRVTEAGLQQIDAATLAAASWDLAMLDPRRIHLWHHGREEVIDISDGHDGRLDPGDTLHFIGRLNPGRHTRESVYWLTYDETAGLRGAPALAPGDPVRWEDDALYQTRFASLSGDRWYGHELVGTPGRDQASITVDLPVSAPAGTTVQVAMTGTADQVHTLAISANGRALVPAQWRGVGAHLATLTLTHTILPGALQLDLQLTSAGTDRVLLDWIALPQVRPAYSATPQTPRVERGPGFDPQFGPAPQQAGATYLIITHHTVRSALESLITMHQQRGEQVGVIDVQVAYDAWSFGERDPEAIRSLIRTAVAQWRPAPRAILLVGAGTARLRGAPGAPDTTLIPPYLVDGDPSRGEIACDTCYTRINTHDPLADLLPDLPIGRLPVRTLSDAQAVVRKLVAFSTSAPTGRWRTQALLLADNDTQVDGTPDPAGSFTATADEVAQLLPQGMHAQRFYYAPDRPTGAGWYRDAAELRCRLFQALDGGARSDRACAPIPPGAETGAALWVYVGHGSPWQWAETTPSAATPYLWYLYDADARTNGSRLPILLSMTCLSGDFANPTLMTTDERLVLHPGGGVVASLSATGQGVNTGQAQLLAGVIPHLFATTGDRTLGAAHLAGVRAIVASGAHLDLAYSFNILGDPLVAVPFAPAHAQYVPVLGGRP